MKTKPFRFLLVVLVGLVASRVAGAADVFPGAQWQEATPASQGLDSAKLKVAVDYLDANFRPQGAEQLVIVRNGYLVWKGPDCEAYHNIWSSTKNFTSTLLGVMVDDGKCKLDDPVAKYLPHLDDKYPTYSKIKLRQAASMSSGYVGEVVGKSDEQPWGEPIHYLNPQKPAYEPGANVAYQDHQVFLVGAVVTRLSGKSEKELFQERIAGPIGMTRWDWGVSGTIDGLTLNNSAGTPNTPGIQTTPLDLARFGLLYLNRGNWDGKQLLSASFVDEAHKNQVPRAGRSRDLWGRYGFFWRNNDVMANGNRMWPSAPPSTYMTNGNGCNFCIVLPEWNMVIVRMGTTPVVGGAKRHAVFDGFFERVGEAMGSAEPAK